MTKTLHALPLLLFVLAAAPGLRASASNVHPVLIPSPREWQPGALVRLARGVRVSAPGGDAEDRFAARELACQLRARGVRFSRNGYPILLLRDTALTAQARIRTGKSDGLRLEAGMQDEGYVLTGDLHGLYVIGHTAAGVFYGAATVAQLVSPGGRTLTTGKLRDWPAMRWRGVHDDLSRGPLPTLEFQKQQIRTFAAYKLNVYSPYFENAVTYRTNPLPGLPGGAMTLDEARELAAYAAHYHVTIVPEQEAFGHLHHLLTWQQYAGLAETPAGSVLAPHQPGSLALITQSFQELAGVFPGPFLHIGADETFELGRGQTEAEVKQRGLGAVYIDFLRQIHAALAPLHRRLLFWGDIAMEDPPLVPQLPHDMIAVAWHYEPEADFRRWLEPYTRAGMETWVAPGVNNWNRVWPNYDTALRNMQGFIAAGKKAGATGVLNTIWNDDGEGLFAEDWYGVLYGAAASWQPSPPDIAQFAGDYGVVFHGDTLGRVAAALQALTSAHLALARAGLGDGKDALFWVDPWTAMGEADAKKLRPVMAEVRTNAEHALVAVADARREAGLRETPALDAMDLGAQRMDFLAFKVETADRIAETYRRLYSEREDQVRSREIGRELFVLSGAYGRTQDLRDGYGYLKDEFSRVWLRENRPYYLGNILAEYDVAMDLWVERGNRLREARQQWLETRTLPAPETIGIPPAP